VNSDARLAELPPEQRQAFLDLLVLVMYVDGHLASVEDTRLRRLLGAMGFESKYDRDREFDAAVTRVRPYAENRDTASIHAKKLAASFGGEEQRQYVAAALEEFITCDAGISPEETRILTAVRELFAT
jgi:uncharacterized tellurite resistance protein B-like protein